MAAVAGSILASTLLPMFMGGGGGGSSSGSSQGQAQAPQYTEYVINPNQTTAQEAVRAQRDLNQAQLNEVVSSFQKQAQDLKSSYEKQQHMFVAQMSQQQKLFAEASLPADQVLKELDKIDDVLDVDKTTGGTGISDTMMYMLVGGGVLVGVLLLSRPSEK